MSWDVLERQVPVLIWALRSWFGVQLQELLELPPRRDGGNRQLMWGCLHLVPAELNMPEPVYSETQARLLIWNTEKKNKYHADLEYREEEQVSCRIF